jgi:hypothetical protein
MKTVLDRFGAEPFDGSARHVRRKSGVLDVVCDVKPEKSAASQPDVDVLAGLAPIGTTTSTSWIAAVTLPDGEYWLTL